VHRTNTMTNRSIRIGLYSLFLCLFVCAHSLSAQCPVLNNTSTFTSPNCVAGVGGCNLCPGNQFTITASGTNLPAGGTVDWYYGTTNNFNPYAGAGTFLGSSNITGTPPTPCAPCPLSLLYMVDACGPDAVNADDYNEFVVIWSGGGFSVDNVTVDLPIGNNGLAENADLGIGCPFQEPNAAALSNISSCPAITVVPVGPGDVVPPNALVVMFMSAGLETSIYNWAALCPIATTVYVMQNSCSRSIGAFTNGNGSGPRTVTISYGCCSDATTYNTSIIQNVNGAAITDAGFPTLYLPPFCGFPTLPFPIPNTLPTPSTVSPFTGTITADMCNDGPFYVVGIVNPQGGPGCTDVTNYMPFNVVCPNPVLTDASICSSSGLFDLNSLEDPAWPNGTWSGVGVTGTNFNPINHLGSNTVTFVPSGPCSTPYTTTVNVTSGPTAMFNSPPSVCSGDPTSLFINFTGAGPWSFTIRNNGVLVGNYTTTDNPYELPLTLSATALISLSNLIEGTCMGANTQVNVPVASAPTGTLTLTGPDEVCNGGSTTLKVSFSGGTAPFTFIISENGIPNPPITTNLNPYIFTDIPSEDITYELTSVSSGICDGIPNGSATVTIGSGVSGSLSPGSDIVCQGEPSDLSFNFVGATPYVFVYSINGVNQPAISTNNPNYTIPLSPNVGNFVYKLVTVGNGGAGACAGTVSGTFNLTVRSAPTLTMTGDASICGAVATTPLTFNFTGTGPYTFVYSIDGVAQPAITTSLDPFTLSVSPASSTTYSPESVTSGGCPGTVMGDANVNIGAGATSSLSGGGSYCQSSPGTPVIINTVGTAPFTIVYSINGTNQPPITTNLASYPLVLPVAVGTYTYALVSVASASACPGAITGSTKLITVSALPNVILSGNASICGGATPLNFNFTGTGPFTVNYTLNGVAQTPIVTSVDPFIFNVSPTANAVYAITSVTAGGCTGTSSGTATVSVGAGASASLSGGGSFCQGTIVSPVIINSVGSTPYTIVYSVNGVNQPPISTNLVAYPIPLPTSSGVFEFDLVSISNSACSGTVTGTSQTITIKTTPTAILSGNATLCGSSTAPLSFNFTGTAPFTVNYAMNGVPQTPITTNLNPYTFNVSPSADAVYVMTSVSANGCTGTVSGSATITVEPALNAVISGGGQTCQGGNGIPLTISFGGPGPYTFVYSANGVNQPAITTNTTPYSLQVNPAIGTTYKIVSLTNGVCQGTFLGSALVLVFTPPTANLIPIATPFCNNATTEVEVNLTGTAPFTFVYAINGVAQPAITTSDDPYMIPINVSTNTTFTLLSLQSLGCIGTVSGTTNIVVNKAPTYTNFDINCNTASSNYTVEFDILGGTPPYVLESGSGTFTGNHFKSNPIALAAPYNIIIHDANNCGDIVVAGVANCNCVTNAGTMNLTQLDICKTATATANPIAIPAPVLEQGDVLKYILHTNPATPVGTILGWSATPTFSFGAGMTIGTTYYISAIAGNVLAGNVDLNDPCLSVAQGTPVVWHESPALALGTGDEICVGETANVSVSCAGSSPFSFVYALNGVNQPLITNQISPFYTISLTPSITTTISLVSISDKYCASGTLDVDTLVTVNKKPLITNFSTPCNLVTNTYTIILTASNGEAPYTLNGVTGTWAGNVFTSSAITTIIPYNIQLSDPNNCGQDIKSGTVNCSCTTNAGTMSQTPLDLCNTTAAVAIFNNNANLDTDDELHYILHTNPGKPVGTILSWGTTPTFSFGVGMTIGTTYYISAIAGNPSGANIDLNDPCLSVALGTPVVWHSQPSAALGAGTEICDGESAQIAVNLTGTAPFAFTYSFNGANQTPVNNINATTYNLNLAPIVTTTIALVSVSDKYCNTGTIGSSSIITVNKTPIITNFSTPCDPITNTYTIKFTASNGELPYTLAGVAGTWVGNIFTSVAISTNVPYSVELTDPNGCGEDTRSGTVNCSCTTEAGEMSSLPVNICVPSAATCIFEGGETVPQGSLLKYILYADPANPENSIIAWSNTTTFPFTTLGVIAETAYYVAAIAGIPTSTGGNIDLTDVCTDISNGTLVIWHNLPNISLGIDQTLCQGDTLKLLASVIGTMVSPPYNIQFQINGITPPQVTNLQTGVYQLVYLPTGNTTITAVSVDEKFCKNNAPNELMEVKVVKTPLISNLTTECDLTLGTYIVKFNITQGVAPYTVGGLSGNITGNQFISNPLPILDNYNITVKDVNDCGQDTRAGQSNCACMTEAGTMNQTPLSLCIGETATAIHDGLQMIDVTEDVFYFILHTSVGNPIGNVIARNNTPVFDFVPGSMFADITYYISAIAGDDDGNGIASTIDPCLKVADGTPVVWHLTPTAKLFDDVYDICPSESQPLTIFFTGKPPYTFNYLLNNVNTPGVSNNASFTINTTLTQNSTFEMVSVKDGNGCSGDATGAVNIVIHSIPVITNVDIICSIDNLSYIVEFDVTNADTDDVNLGGSLQGNYDLVTGHFVSGAVPINNTYSAVASDNWQCGLDSISGVAVCICETDAGTMNSTLISKCYGESVTAPTTINPTLDDNDTLIYILVKSVNTLSSTTTFASNSVPFFTYNVTLNPDSIYYIVAVVGDKNATGNGINLGDPCLSISNGTPVKWAKPINGFLSDNQEICQGDTASIVLHFEGGGPYTFNYVANSIAQGVQTTNLDSFILKLSPTLSVNYNLSSLVGLNGCVGTVNGGAALSVLFLPDIIELKKTCDFITDSYVISFKITNGASPNLPYIVTGVTGTLNDTTFVSDPIPINQNYNISITNTIGCEKTISGTSGCFCTTDAGTLNTTPITACVTGILSVVHNGNFDLDPEDVLQYVLYSDPAIFPLGIIEVSDVPQFTFQAFMNVGTEYYVSAIAGDQLANGNVNPDDPCLSLSPPVVVKFEAAPTALINADTTVCEGENVVIPLSFTGTGPYTFVYALNGVSQFPIQVPNSTFSVSSTNILTQQTYTLVSVSNSSCAGTVNGTAIVKVTPSPRITLSGDERVCPGVESEITLTMSGGSTYNVILDQNPGSSITYNNINSGFSFTNTLSETTTFSITSFTAIGNQCEVKIGNDLTISVVDVEISTEVLDQNGFNISCGGASDGSAMASATGGTLPYTFLWSNNQTTSTISNLEAGPYSVTVTDIKGCSDVSEVNLTEPSPMTLGWKSQAPSCLGNNTGVLTISEVFGGANPYKIKVNNILSQTSNTFPIVFEDLSAGNYTISLEDANGCTLTENTSIDNAVEVLVSLGDDVTLIYGDSLKLVGVTNSSIIDTFIWSPTTYLQRPDSLITWTLPSRTVNYKLTVIDTAGCIGTDDLLVKVRKEDRIYIPNVLNLGSTKANDIFTIYGGAEVSGINLMKIYDRWGECVFENIKFPANDPSEGWKGFFRDKKVLPGVYIYVVEIAFFDGSVQLMKGDVTVVHE
jgi:hypothetical protein